MMTLKQLAARMEAMAAKAAVAPEVAAARLAPVMIATAKEVIGTHVLRDLMESTQDERERLGFTPNDPLKRTGSFQDSIEGGAVGTTAFAGTNDPRGEWFEFGTPKVKPKMQPFSNFAITLGIVEPEALAIGKAVSAEVLES
jgi:hypothetical protein